MRTLLERLRIAILAFLLAFGVASATPVVAQEATEAAGQVTEQAEDIVEEDGEGFDWGLLGLLGLGGLAGLFRRPQPVVHEDLNRSRGTTTTRDTIRPDDDRTTV